MVYTVKNGVSQRHAGVYVIGVKKKVVSFFKYIYLNPHTTIGFNLLFLYTMLTPGR